MKVQLFVPPLGYVAQRWGKGTSMPPLGILSLAAVLEQEGIEVDVVPADVLDYNWRDVAGRIRDFAPDIVGCTTTTENRFDSFKLAKTAKQVDERILTVLGGPHMTMAGADTLYNIRDVDIAVIGEGEITIIELVKAASSGTDFAVVKGICCRKDDDVFFSGNREKISNLDDLPYPARHLIPLEKYNFYVDAPGGKRLKAQNIMTSRGCPFNCYFCATPINWGRKMRGCSPERVADEIEHLIRDFGAEYIWFYDDTMNYNPGRLHKIMDLIIERKFNIKFCNEFRIDAIDKPLLEKMVKAGLVWGHFGIEAGSARVRKDIVKKNFDIEKAFQFVRWAGELGFVPDAFFIFSHYSETWQEAQETIRVMEELREVNPDTEFATALLHVYPGTPLEKIARQKGFLPKEFSWSKKKDLKKVFLLPAAQGYVPLFKDKLSWFQIADLVMRWSAGEKKMFSGSKIKSALRTLSSFKGFLIYCIFFLTMLKYKGKQIFKKIKGGKW
jgi:radical SAM superfamily enzyme YgiQ (UPF0313 family)